MVHFFLGGVPPVAYKSWYVLLKQAAASMSKGVGRVARVGVTPGMTAMNDDDDNISCK